jgi:hypothetical protein
MFGGSIAQSREELEREVKELRAENGRLQTEVARLRIANDQITYREVWSQGKGAGCGSAFGGLGGLFS